ncbi:c-type cytochrome [Shimia sp. FJ5]|uniref:c-type cytochrome n=1 Tax=Shimia sp. FJ5 TaxID=3079054 RepID=UPI00260796FA|nr:cytochrome c [Shimia sp. FJ5]MDV4143760.1 cytochrome c [Shimia sp. FJ5]
MRRAWGIAALALAGVVIGCASVESRGRTVYDLHCVMCHGESGRGDGYFADQLLSLPPDLTRLARENGGTFPATRVALSITGEGRDAHFSGAMPDFSDLDVSGIAPDSQLEAVVAYLESIQQ